MEILVSWTSSLIVPADSQESKYIFFLKKSLQCSSTLSQYAFLFLVAIHPTIVHPQLLVCGTLRRRAHLSSTSGPGATSQPQVNLKVYIGLSLSLSLSRKPGPLISTARTLRKGTSFNQRKR
jgi:hypothetical protein